MQQNVKQCSDKSYVYEGEVLFVQSFICAKMKKRFQLC